MTSASAAAGTSAPCDVAIAVAIAIAVLIAMRPERATAAAVWLAVASVPTLAEGVRAAGLALVHRELGNRPRLRLLAFDAGQRGADELPVRGPELVARRLERIGARIAI